ncbi:uncharacterized protein N0V89_005414 [Didymosphaeria variabile]|uniref:Ubiquitin-like domain-containing protein n=1 Tax=Didymosphaeria variabile TaxID=1932322 RepID=A0A9W8XLL3_9PLEO|nr:uncharacterized protein N0V89_005414 [Didymosphaeria variabile]KAJ4353684.1 hypothetical protein N0V89_005414 [Didymosphaeria variabile]
MSELTFCKTFLTALDARPVKLSSDHIADARQYPDDYFERCVNFRDNLPHPQAHEANPPHRPPPSITASSTSIYDLKSAYSTKTSIPAAKIKILYRKKPVTDSKTVAEVLGSDAGSEVEFGVMVLGGAVATPVQSPPAAAPGEEEKGLASGAAQDESKAEAPAAQGPSGKEVVNESFWEELRGFVVQRIRDEKEGERLVGVFKSAWEKEQ